MSGNKALYRGRLGSKLSFEPDYVKRIRYDDLEKLNPDEFLKLERGRKVKSRKAISLAPVSILK